MKIALLSVLLSIFLAGLMVNWVIAENLLPNKIYQYRLENGLKIVGRTFR